MALIKVSIIDHLIVSHVNSWVFHCNKFLNTAVPERYRLTAAVVCTENAFQSCSFPMVNKSLTTLEKKYTSTQELSENGGCQIQEKQSEIDFARRSQERLVWKNVAFLNVQIAFLHLLVFLLQDIPQHKIHCAEQSGPVDLENACQRNELNVWVRSKCTVVVTERTWVRNQRKRRDTEKR